ncbi:MAG: hypothetical protein V9G19_11065 [Tetrasphaera sp.]
MTTQTKPKTTRRRWIILLIAALLATAAWFLIDQSVLRGIVRVDDGATTAEVAAAAPESASQPSVTADGYLAPTHYALLELCRVQHRGDDPRARGRLGGGRRALITLENRAQQAALAQATANLGQAQAHLATVRAGARPEEIAQAEAAAEVATMNLYRLADGATLEQVASADRAIAAAQASLARVQAGAAPAGTHRRGGDAAPGRSRAAQRSVGV